MQYKILIIDEMFRRIDEKISKRIETVIETIEQVETVIEQVEKVETVETIEQVEKVEQTEKQKQFLDQLKSVVNNIFHEDDSHHKRNLFWYFQNERNIRTADLNFKYEEVERIKTITERKEKLQQLPLWLVKKLINKDMIKHKMLPDNKSSEMFIKQLFSAKGLCI